MTLDIYLLKNGSPTGPFSSDDFSSLYAQGLITDSDIIWHVGLAGWISVPRYLGSETPNQVTVGDFADASSPHLLTSSPKDLSFFRSIPGLICCVLGMIALLACFQIIAEVWRYPDRPEDAKKTERIARETTRAMQVLAANHQEHAAMEYERIRREDSDDRIRKTWQDYNDYQIRHMTSEQRADAVNRQTLNRLNGR